jgi:hypothetical protein
MTHSQPSHGIPPSTEPMARSAAAERMRLHRDRRRKGLRCLIVELRETEIDVLIRLRLLDPEMRNDRKAVRQAFHAFLDRTLGATS